MTTPTLQRNRTVTDDDTGIACHFHQTTPCARWE